MCVVAFISTLLALLLSITVMSERLFSSVRKEIRNEATYIAALLDAAKGDDAALLGRLGDNNRISLIDPDGRLLYDNKVNIAKAENHSDREEFKEAISGVYGEAVRVSNSRDEQTYYFAVRLSDGNVLRVANTTSGVFRIISDMTPYFFIVAAVGIILAMVLAHYFTKRIIEPINSFDPEKPMESKIYDELSPLVRRLDRQNKQIEYNINALKEKQHELIQITDGMREGLIVLNNTLNVTYINKGAAKLLSVNALEVIGKHILSVYRNAELNTICATALGGVFSETETFVGERSYRFLASPLLRDNGASGVIILIVDETEKNLAERQRREFSANVSHELRTPLTSISGYAELIKNGMVKSDKVSEFAGIIYEEATKLVTLIGDIIRLSKLDEGGAALEKEEVDLYDIAKATAARLESAAENKNVKITVRGTHVKVFGVPQILDEVIYNLCDNAVKYNVDGGHVSIYVKSDETHAHVSVSDTGIGIPLEERERVYERFYRFDKSHSKDIPGTGLGLSIVKHGVKFHGGTVDFESTPGKGTTFRVAIPKTTK